MALIRHARFFQSLLSEINIYLTQAAVLYQDNEVTIRILLQKINESRTMHIALRYNIIQEFIQDGLIVAKYLSTDLIIADTLTKALPRLAFVRYQNRLLNHSPPSFSSLLNM